MNWTPIEIPPVNDNGESDLFMVWLDAGRWRPAFYDTGRGIAGWNGWRDGQSRELLKGVTHYMKEVNPPPLQFSPRLINHEIDGIDLVKPTPKSDLDMAVKRAIEVGDLPAGIIGGIEPEWKETPLGPPEVAPPAPPQSDFERVMAEEMEVNGEDYKPPVGYAVKKFAVGDTVGHSYEDGGEVTGPHQIKLIEVAGDGVMLAKLSGVPLWVRLDGLKYWGASG